MFSIHASHAGLPADQGTRWLMEVKRDDVISAIANLSEGDGVEVVVFVKAPKDNGIFQLLHRMQWVRGYADVADSAHLVITVTQTGSK